MVNRVLTSPYLWWFDPLPAGQKAAGCPERAGVSNMAMTASSRAAQGVGSEQSERSPFARLAELLAPHQPGKPLITLSLGEPQHPVPGFVGPVLANHIGEFGRYPIARGIEPFRRAAANWLANRFQLPRAIDP
jgi:N-succinyldiaminopimelate aminotransferase